MYNIQFFSFGHYIVNCNYLGKNNARFDYINMHLWIGENKLRKVILRFTFFWVDKRDSGSKTKQMEVN